MAHAQSPSDTNDLVHFDYLDNRGQLQGGSKNIPHVFAPQSLAIAPSAVAATSNTVIENGVVSNRVNFVFLGDGYQQNELAKYAKQVQTITGGIFNESPFKEYASYFNVYRIDVASSVSGVTNEADDDSPQTTPLSMNYWCSKEERLLCVDQAAAAKYAALAPGSSEVFALANSTKYGGAGYAHLSTLAAGDNLNVELALHEVGHSFAGLADEYDYGADPKYQGAEPLYPNVSIYDLSSMASKSVKWFRWLSGGLVGSCEGANYREEGIYRPTVNSRMRALSNPYGDVNVEQFIFSIYKDVKLIDEATPAQDFHTSQLFFVKPLMPSTNTVAAEWSIDGRVIATESQFSLDTTKLKLKAGKHFVSVVVKDLTPLVRDESPKINSDDR